MSLNPRQHAAQAIERKNREEAARKRGRPRKKIEPTKKVIADSAINATQTCIENLSQQHTEARVLLTEMCRSDEDRPPHVMLSLAEKLILVVNLARSNSSKIRRFADGACDRVYYPSEASYSEAYTAVSRLKAAAQYMESPVADSVTMTNPGAMAMDAMDTILRFTNK